MTTRVATEREVSLNEKKYRIIGQVQSSLASLYPPKVVSGDFTGDSQQWASTLRMSDWRDGIGNYGQSKIDPALGRVPDAWWSTCQLRHYNHLVLPQLATLTAASGVTGSFTVGAIGELASEIYAAFGTDVRKYNNATDSWGSSLATLPAVATDVIKFRLGGVVYLAFATTGGYTYTSNGITWVNDTQDTLYMASWDDAVWGIDNTGLMWKSTAIGVEVSNAQLPLENSSVNDLFLGRNSAGTLILFAMTTAGLFAHDNANTKWLFTELEFPFHPDNGKGSTRWRDSMYIPSGLGIYRYVQGENQAIVTVMGLDRHDGVPSDKRGVIRQLIGSHTDLLAITDATTAPSTTLNNFATSGLASHRSQVITVDTGFSHIAAWDERGWEIKWLGGASGTAITAAYVSNAYSVYRLWWAQNQRIYFMPLRRDITNPTEISSLTYATSAEHITPWFTADQNDVDKLAMQLLVECKTMTANETAVIDYALNYADSTWTNLGTISINGITTYNFPNSTTPTGTAFRAIRFRITLARGSTTTLTPDVVSLTFIYRKKLPAKWQHSFTVDLDSEYAGRSPKDMRSDLITAIESTAKVEFTHRSDTGGTRNFYVDVVSATGLENTGDDERGTSQVTVVEP
jgi:hypothetical protein